MNNTFNLQRFYLLLKKHLRDSRNSLLLYILGMAGLLLVVYGITIVSSFHNEFPANTQLFLYLGGLLLGGTIYSAAFYNVFSNKARTIQYLSLPASRLEKLLLGFLFTQIIYLAVYLLLFGFIDHFMCILYNKSVSIPAWGTAPNMRDRFLATPLRFFSDSQLTVFLLFYTLFSSIMHLGSISFNKNAFFKTLAFSIAFFSLLILISNKMLVLFIPEEIMPHGKFINDSFRLNLRTVNEMVVTLPEVWANFLNYCIPLLILTFSWVAAYFKLKEKQV